MCVSFASAVPFIYGPTGRAGLVRLSITTMCAYAEPIREPRHCVVGSPEPLRGGPLVSDGAGTCSAEVRDGPARAVWPISGADGRDVHCPPPSPGMRMHIAQRLCSVSFGGECFMRSVKTMRVDLTRAHWGETKRPSVLFGLTSMYHG